VNATARQCLRAIEREDRFACVHDSDETAAIEENMTSEGSDAPRERCTSNRERLVCNGWWR